MGKKAIAVAVTATVAPKIALTEAGKMLVKAIKSGDSAYKLTLKACQLRADEKQAFGAAKILEEKYDLLLSWARGVAEVNKLSDSFFTVEAYVKRSAKIALVPDATGEVYTGVGDQRVLDHEVKGVEEISTAKDFAALASAASAEIAKTAKNPKRFQKVAGSGRGASTPVAAPAPVKVVQTDAEVTSRILSGDGIMLHNAIRTVATPDARDGKTHHLWPTLVAALAGAGYSIVSMALQSQAAQIAKAVQPDTAVGAAMIKAKTKAAKVATK